jgi:hypothetical protein
LPSVAAQVSDYHETIIYSGLGDEQDALAALEKARKQKRDWLIYLNVVANHPLFSGSQCVCGGLK